MYIMNSYNIDHATKNKVKYEWIFSILEKYDQTLIRKESMLLLFDLRSVN
jgi:hypothetical protein